MKRMKMNDYERLWTVMNKIMNENEKKLMKMVKKPYERLKWYICLKLHIFLK